jgi:hypothetical protein
MRTTKRETNAIREYIEEQAHEVVVHLEKVASERIGPARHDIWDVHASRNRWWVVTNPTNFYSQGDFKSRDVVLTFHIGLALRVSYLNEKRVPVKSLNAALLPGSWRRWQQAFDAYESGDEAETFQAVGMRLRECLISFVEETRHDDLIPKDAERPKNADFKSWAGLLADYLAAGDSLAALRSFLKSAADTTWKYVNWLTHAKNALRLDAEIGLRMVQHLLGIFTAAVLRKSARRDRCPECGSYGVVGGLCEHCSWVNQSYQPPKPRRISKATRARRLAEPCTPSSDIQTFITPDDVADRL